MAERHGRILARLAELGLAHAERLHEQAMTADDPKASAELGLSFHRVSRSIRQSIALEARLVRDAQACERRGAEDLRAFREEAGAGVPRDARRIEARKDEIRQHLHEAIRSEVEHVDREQADYLSDLLEERLELLGRSNGFGLEPLEEHLARFYSDFGLFGPAAYGSHDDDETGAIEFDAAPPESPPAPSG